MRLPLLRLLPGAPALLLLATFAGCRDFKKSIDPNELIPHGDLRAYATEEMADLADRHARQFEQQFPAARVTVETRSTRAAIVALLADSGRAAYTDRLFNAEEQAVNDGHRDSLRATPRHVGFGALVFVAHPSNPVEALPVASLPALVRGSGASWTSMGGAGPVQLATTGKNSGTYEVLATQFVPGAGDLVPAFVGASPRAVMDFVAAQPGGLGVVPLSALGDTLAAGVRVLPLRVGVGDSSYVIRPSQLSVYEQSYPLHYKLYLYTTGRLSLLPSRFAGFVGGRVGQRAVQAAGLVPQTVPARTVTLK